MSQIEILDCFDRAGPLLGGNDGASRTELTLSAADIIGRTKLPRSSVFRDLKTLVTSGFVYQDPATKRYALGPRVLQLGLTARRQLGSEDQVVIPLMDLMRQTAETVTFSLIDLPWRTCVYVIEAPSELRHFAQIGARYPLHLGAAGKVILAQLAPDIAVTVLKSSGITKAQSAEVLKQLIQIRNRGYAVTTGERVVGASSVAAPVFVGHAVFGSVAVAGPTERFNSQLEKHQRIAVEAGKRLSERLSARSMDGMSDGSTARKAVVVRQARRARTNAR